MKALEIFNIRLITLSVVPILVLLVSVTSYGQGESVGKNKAAQSAGTKSTTRNKPAKEKEAGSINWKRNRRYGFIVKYKNSPNIGWVAAQVKKILLKYGFSAEQFSSVSAPDELYAYDRKPSNSYLGFDSSVPLDVREEVTKLIREILPNVHIEIMEKDADDYFLLWIL
jgi:hypothetical protein